MLIDLNVIHSYLLAIFEFEKISSIKNRIVGFHILFYMSHVI